MPDCDNVDIIVERLEALNALARSNVGVEAELLSIVDKPIDHSIFILVTTDQTDQTFDIWLLTIADKKAGERCSIFRNAFLKTLLQGFGSGSARIHMFLPCPDPDPGKKVKK